VQAGGTAAEALCGAGGSSAGQGPATIQTIIPVDLARPRDLDSRSYLATRDQVFAAMGMSLRIGESSAAGGDTAATQALEKEKGMPR